MTGKWEKAVEESQGGKGVTEKSFAVACIVWNIKNDATRIVKRKAHKMTKKNARREIPWAFVCHLA